MYTLLFWKPAAFILPSGPNIDAKTITATQVDNKNRVKSITKRIKFKDRKYTYLEKNSMKSLKVRPRVELNHFDDIDVSKMFDKSKMIEDNIYISLPDVSASNGAVPIHIEPYVDVKSVTLFASNNYNEMVFVCQWIPVDGYEIISYDVKIKMITGYVRVVVESKNGELYTVTRYTDIPIAGGTLWWKYL